MIRMSSIWTGTAEYLFPLAPDLTTHRPMTGSRRSRISSMLIIKASPVVVNARQSMASRACQSFFDKGRKRGPLILQLGQLGSLRFDHFGRRPRDERLVAELGAKRAELAIKVGKRLPQ